MSEELRVLVPFEVILVNKNVFKSMILVKLIFQEYQYLKKIEKQYNQINQSKTDFVKTVSKEGLGATPTPTASGDHLPEQPAISTPSASGDHLPEEQENGVTSFVIPQGQNDFHHAYVDQTVQIDKPKDTIVERDPIVQTLPENNLSRNYRNFENPRTKKNF